MWLCAVKRVGFYLAASVVFMAIMLTFFTIFYHFVEPSPNDPNARLGWLDSFYFTVVTTRTIGFGDIHPQTALGKWGTIFNALLPATVFLGSSLVVLQAFFESLEIYWKEWLMSKHRNHTIVISDVDLLPSILNEYGALDVNLVVVHNQSYEHLPPKLQQRLNDSNYFHGDPTNDDALRKVQIEHAANILIATADDTTNLYVLVTAKGLNPDVRATVRVNNAATEAKFRTVGADHLLPASEILGRMLSHAATTPITNDFLVMLNTNTLDPFVTEVTPESEHYGVPVREVYHNAIAVYSSGRYIYNLQHETLRKGDIVLCVSVELEDES